MPKIVKDDEIYQAVIRVVSERGYASATTKQMADAADISEMTLFRKYENKAQLVKQAISFIVDQADFSNSAQYTGDLQADLLRVVKAYQNSAVKHGDFVTALIPEMSRHPELIDSVDAPMNVFRSIGKLIKRYQEEGELKQEPELIAVGVLLGPLMYAAMLQKAIPDNLLPPLEVENHIAGFLYGRAK